MLEMNDMRPGCCDMGRPLQGTVATGFALGELGLATGREGTLGVRRCRRTRASMPANSHSTGRQGTAGSWEGWTLVADEEPEAHH